MIGNYFGRIFRFWDDSCSGRNLNTIFPPHLWLRGRKRGAYMIRVSCARCHCASEERRDVDWQSVEEAPTQRKGCSKRLLDEGVELRRRDEIFDEGMESLRKGWSPERPQLDLQISSCLRKKTGHRLAISRAPRNGRGF